jgi:signal transduction histidine kinase
LNTIVNATHAIAEKTGWGSGQKGKITVNTRVQEGFAEIRIGNAGPGIKEEIRSRIFDPIFATKVVGKGTGRGLAISYSVIVEKYGGTITFETSWAKERHLSLDYRSWTGLPKRHRNAEEYHFRCPLYATNLISSCQFRLLESPYSLQHRNSPFSQDMICL